MNERQWHDVVYPHGDERREDVYPINPKFLIDLFKGRQFTLDGVPADAIYRRSWYDPEKDLIYIVVETQTVEPNYETVMPMPKTLTVTEHREERESQP